MGGLRTDVERLTRLLPDPIGFADGYVVTTQSYVDERGITQYTYTLKPSGGGGTGTVTSVDGSGGATGLTLTGGPITTAGTLTLGGTLAIASGGTGQTTAPNAINALLPSQGGNSGKFLTTNGTVASWANLNAGLSFRIGRQDGAVLLAGFKRTFIIPCAYDQLTTGSWELYTFPGSTCSIDIQTIAFGSTDPTTGNSIVGGIQPATSGGQTATGVTSGWTASLSRGAFIAIQVLSNDLAREIRFFMPGRKVL